MSLNGNDGFYLGAPKGTLSFGGPGRVLELFSLLDLRPYSSVTLLPPLLYTKTHAGHQ